MKRQESPVPQASWVSHLNAIGQHGTAESLVTIASDDLLDNAARNTGLSDYGDDNFKAGLNKLVSSLNDEAQLTLTGRIIAKTELIRILTSRLSLIDFVKRNPDVRKEKIETPIFIVGMGRTGSSILHEYLMSDPLNRAPLAWEMKMPAPLIINDSPLNSDSMIAWNDSETRLMYEIDESLASKHEAHSKLPEECSQMLALQFQSGHFFSRNHVPSYAGWNAQTDVSDALDMHKLVLQTLQYRSNSAPKRWVLKYGGHMAHLPQLFSCYPDARVIHTHRDPCVVVKSFVSLIASLRLMRSDFFDPNSSAEMLNQGMMRGLEKVIEERTSGVIPNQQITDIHFKELMHDNINCIRKAFNALQISFNDDSAKHIAAYASSKPRNKFGKHIYAYQDSVNLEHERRRYQRYLSHYNITKEY